MTNHDDPFDDPIIDIGGHGSDIDIERELTRLRADLRPAAFDAGFTDRVMHRLATQASTPATPTTPLPTALQTVFWRVAPLAAAAVLVIGSMNLFSAQSDTQPFMDKVLGLPTVTVAAAYTLDENLNSTFVDTPGVTGR